MSAPRVFGDGFLPFHIELEVEAGAAPGVTSKLKAMEIRFEDLKQQLAAIEGVERVVFEGPQSAVLIVLRMAQALAGARARMSAALGDGPIGRAIETQLRAWAIEGQLRAVRGDSPLEFSVRDPHGAFGSLRRYAGSRRGLRSGLKANLHSPPPDALIVNRSNATLLSLASAVSSAGGMVSQRIRPLGRHDDPEQLRAMIARCHHLVFCSSGGLARALLRLLGLSAPRGWPKALDEHARILVEQLRELPGARRLVIFLHHNQREALFCAPGVPCVLARLSSPTDFAAKTARLQGAALALSLLRRQRGQRALPDSERALRSFAQKALATAHEGTDQRPWRYPNTFDQKASTQCFTA